MKINLHLPAPILVLGLLLQPQDVAGLDPHKAITQYGQEVWLSENGLPHNAITSIIGTRDGFIWVGTQEGLVRFDGITFTVFSRGNTSAIRDSFISSLAEDQKGNLWIGTRGGLLRYQGGRFKLYTTQDGLSMDYVRTLYVDRADKLWIGTYGGGLNVFHNNLFNVYTTQDGLADNLVRAIYQDRQGQLWIGTAGGLSRYDDVEGVLTSFSPSNGRSGNSIRSIIEDRHGSIWLGTDGGGLYRLVEGKFERFASEGGLNQEVVTSVLEDRDGSLWVGTNGGLHRIRNGSELSVFNHESGLSHDRVGPLYEDVEGNLWVGTRIGLNVLREGKFTSYTQKEGLSDDFVRTVFEDREGKLWIGTGRGGLNVLEEGRFSSYTTRDGLCDMEVRSITQDREGSLWVGTGRGLSRFRAGKFTTYNRAQGLTSNVINVVYEDGKGELWVGTGGGGLHRGTNGKFDIVALGNNPASDVVRSILEDSKGRLWVGTEGGLIRFEGDELARFTRQEGLSSDFVFSLYEDREGVLWIGTAHGLNCYDKGEFCSFTTRDGLFEDVIFQILEDGQGHLWLSGSLGVSRIDKQQLEEFAEGRIAELSPVAYGKADGMKGSECNGATQPAGWRSRDGSLWFPTIRGLATIDPARIRIDRRPPQILIENFVADQQSYQPATQPVLSPGTSTLEFHYTGLSFVAPKKIQFRYRLVGFDEKWIDAGRRRSAYYTNLPPGEYRFQVAASNHDGVWSQEGASFGFRLRPHFYQTGAFYVLSGLFVVLSGVGVFRFRVRQLRSRQEELETLVADRTGQLEEANRALVELALIDSMTGVANHRHFVERLDEEWRRAIRSRTSLAVVMCDIDCFKAYNDRYGHEAGNLCLRRVAGVLSEAIRRPGDLVARYGGDEFVMILCGSDSEGARALAETLPGRFEAEGLEHESSEIARHVTVSVGLATMTPTQNFTSDGLIAAADAAMYRAKKDGRNRVWISDPVKPRTH